MVVFNGYCRPLKGKVDFEVTEVNALDTVKGTKWQVKGVYDTHIISVFTSEDKAKVILERLQNNTIQVFDAEIAYQPPSNITSLAAEEEDDEEQLEGIPIIDIYEEDEGMGMASIYDMMADISRALTQKPPSKICAYDENTEISHNIIDVKIRDNFLNIYIEGEGKGADGSIPIAQLHEVVRAATRRDLEGVQVLDFITGDKYTYLGSDDESDEGFYITIGKEGADDDDDDDDERFTLNLLLESFKGLKSNRKVVVQDENDKQMAIRMIRYDDYHEDFNIVITNEQGITWLKLKRQILKLVDKHENLGIQKVDILNQTNDESYAIQKISDGIIYTDASFTEDEGDFEPATVKELIEHLEEKYDEPDTQEIEAYVQIKDGLGDVEFEEGDLSIDEVDDEIVIQPHEVLTQASESFEAEVDYTKMTVKQLKVELKARGLKLSGKKAVLLERLRLDIVEGGDWENPDKVNYEKDIREQQKADKESKSVEAENTCAECGEIVADEDIIGDGTNRGLCCVPDYYDESEDFEAESSMPSDEVLTDAEVPPMLFEQYIPPEVWNHIDDSDKQEYIRTGDERLLSCPECGFTKAELRTTNGFCFATDSSSPVYNEGASCPYSKMFAPLHWLEPKNEYSEGFEDAVTDELYTTTNRLSAESPITLNTPEDVVKTHTTTISNELYGEIGDDLPESVSINYTKDGSKVILGYFDSDKRFIENIKEMESGKIMESEGNENTYSAEEMLRAESDRRKQFYVQALDKLGDNFEAEEDDDDELGDMGPFTHLENNAESFESESVEFHEEEIYVFRDNLNTGYVGKPSQFKTKYGSSDVKELKQIIKQKDDLERVPSLINFELKPKTIKRVISRKTPMPVDFNWTHQWNAESFSAEAETVEFHEEELYTPGDEDICVNCNGIDKHTVWIEKGSIVCNTCQMSLGEQYGIPDEEVERRLFGWDNGKGVEAPIPVTTVEKKENNNLLLGLLALGAGIAVIAPTQIKKYFGK